MVTDRINRYNFLNSSLKEELAIFHYNKISLMLLLFSSDMIQNLVLENNKLNLLFYQKKDKKSSSIYSYKIKIFSPPCSTWRAH